MLPGRSRRALRPLLIGDLHASGDERTVRRDWRRRSSAARIVKSFTIGAMGAARVHGVSGCRAIGGFTLIELMVVVAVVGILAIVAYPAYTESVRKSRRGDAIAELNKVAQAQERWRANNSTFNNADVSSAATGLRLVTGTTVAVTYTIPSGYYTITIGNAAASPTTYTATATAIGAQATDTRCASLTLTMTGGNLAYTSNPAANAAKCWSR
jgi:type IV pilus assembly protein PilE